MIQVVKMAICADAQCRAEQAVADIMQCTASVMVTAADNITHDPPKFAKSRPFFIYDSLPSFTAYQSQSSAQQ